ncbi:hypothetical protein C5167_021204 [Papaver somniferum]|uniref:Uncharacterized protein n=1 Tax=Papaver somniferum TaxID=3469 RepID=A0A4Y7IYJ8_PAPSO|nr:hypothetical protein C5167_021204 [Papaver somniferum]
MLRLSEPFLYANFTDKINAMYVFDNTPLDFRRLTTLQASSEGMTSWHDNLKMDGSDWTSDEDNRMLKSLEVLAALLYKQNGTERENTHYQVKQEDWEKLFTWFESDEFQCDPETGEVVEQIEFYKLTHFKNDVWTCHTSEENYGKMLELRAAPTPEGSTPLTDAQICEEVLGVRSGYVKGLGHGYEKPSSSSIEYNAELGEALRRADEAEKRNKELEERVDEQNRTIQGLVTDTMDIRRMSLEMQGNRQSTPENRQSTS